jgi:hypothetical protein
MTAGSETSARGRRASWKSKTVRETPMAAINASTEDFGVGENRRQREGHAVTRRHAASRD